MEDELVDILFQFEYNILEYIDICKIKYSIKAGSNIEEVGARKLARMEWPALKEINLG